MPKKVGKIWTPIDTSNQQEVEKHPLKARVQSFRNGWLKFRNEISATRWTRIAMPKITTTFTKYEEVRGCLGPLSENLSKTKNKNAALGEIQLTSSKGNWKQCLTDLNFRKLYTANQLQQLRKNCELLLNESLSPNQRAFLTEVFKRVDSDLVNIKGYDHSKVSPDRLLELSSPPGSDPPPLLVANDAPQLRVDTPLPLAEGPPPTVSAAPLPVVAALPDVPPPNDPPPPLPDVVQIEEHILDVIDRDLANSAVKKAMAAASQRTEGAPLPSDAPPPPPPDDAPPPLPELPQANADVSPPTPMEEQQAGKANIDVHGAKPRPRLMSNAVKPTDSAQQKEAEALSEPSLPARQPRKLGHTRFRSEGAEPKPRLMTKAQMQGGGKAKETQDLNSKRREQREEALFKNLVADRTTLKRPQIPPKIDKAVEPWDNVGDVDATPPRQAPAEAKLPDMPTPMGAQVPDWLKDFEIRATPKERAHDLAEGLLRAIDHSQRAKGENGPKWIFLFLNRLADPALDDLVGEAIGAALASRVRDNQNPGIDLHYLNSAMRSLAVRREFWELGISAQKSTRLTAILSLWEKIREPLAVSADPLEPPDFNRLMLILQSMELPAPAAAPPAPRPLRREWSQSNT